MNELAFKFMVVLWVGFGVFAVWLFFRHALAASVLRSCVARMGGAGGVVGWIALVAIVVLMIVLGMMSYLYTIVAEDRRVRGTIDRMSRGAT